MNSLPAQNWDPERYSENARFLSDLGAPVVDLLAPQSQERILDLGCGDGALSIKLAETGCDIIGIDTSPEMVAAAQSRGLTASVIDARDLQFDAEFDAVFSNATLHWINEPERVIAGVWRALKPSGRFVGEFGGQGNVATIINAIESALASRGVVMKNPWFFPSAEEYQKLLESFAFVVDSIRLFQRPTPLPGDMASWLKTFGLPYILAVSATSREEFITQVVELLRSKLCNENGNWVADYVRLRFSAVKAAHTT